MKDIWIIADVPQLAEEMLNPACDLSSQKGGRVRVFVNGDESAGQQTIFRGADELSLIPQVEGKLWEDYAGKLAEMIQAEQPWLVMVGSTRRGRDLAGQIAGLLDAVCVSDCKSVALVADQVVATRMMYGGLAEKTVELKVFPAILTVALKTFDPRDADDSRQGEVTRLDAPENLAVKVTERMAAAAQDVNLGEAERVVGVGRGFAEESELSLARDLAEALNAEMACSRPIAEFFKWLPENQYLGISGQVIKPQLYLAVGISGQAQHVYGARDAKVIMAINKDADAPMVKMSDYYILGDLHEVLPLLTEALREANA